MKNQLIQPCVDMQIFIGVEMKNHYHQEIELFYVIEGTVDVKIDEKVYHMKAEDVIIINSGKKHSYCQSFGSKGDALACCFHISYQQISDYTNKSMLLFWCNSMEDSDNSYDELRTIMRQLLIDYTIGQENQYFNRYGLYYKLMHFVTNHYIVSEVESAKQSTKDRDDARLAEIINYVSANYSSDISLQDLANRLYLSNTYLSKYIKKRFGKNFLEYVTKVRLLHAVEVLLYTDENITKIALNCGFSSIASFNRIFKGEYGMTPSVYRQEMKKTVKTEDNHYLAKNKKETDKRLQQHFGVVPTLPESSSNAEKIELIARAGSGTDYRRTWNQVINCGQAKNLTSSKVQQAVVMARKDLGIQYIRFCNIFSDDMYMVSEFGHYNFTKLFTIIDFLMEHDILPFIELTETPDRIYRNIFTLVKAPCNVTVFKSYEEWLATLDALMGRLCDRYGIDAVSQWRFELWDDQRTEVYKDKRPYVQIFKDSYTIIKKYAPNAKVGGAGKHLGWYKEHTIDSIRFWIDNGVYPDFISYTYFPYAASASHTEAASKRKTDENDLQQTITELEQLFLQFGYSPKELYITSWNFSSSDRNPFHDSCWKGSYIIKSYIDTLEKLDALGYSMLTDVIGEYFDTPQLLNGIGGLISRNRIEKPAFFAIWMLSHLYQRLLCKGDGYILTEDSNGNYAFVLTNFKKRNYMYYVKEEDENTYEEHYKYFIDQLPLKVQIRMEGVSETTYIVRTYSVNRQYGSVMDEWSKMSFLDELQRGDIEYLKRICVPQLTLEQVPTTGHVLNLDLLLQPMEIMLVEVFPSTRRR